MAKKKAFLVTEATVNDIPTLNKIWNRYQSEPNNKENEIINKENFSHLIDNKSSCVVLAKFASYTVDNGEVQPHENQMIGFSIVKKHPEGREEDTFAYVTELAVSSKKEHNSKDIATRMLKKVEQICKKEGLSTIFARCSTKNPITTETYLSNGFEAVSYPPNYYSDYRVNESEQFFKKELNPNLAF